MFAPLTHPRPGFMMRRLAAALATVLIVAGLALPAAGAAAPAWPHTASDLSPDPALRYGRLANGLGYVLMANDVPRDRVSLHLYVHAGSLHETDAEQGLAHFLEHMLFDGSTHFPPGELVKYFQRIGMDFGADANAHTGFDETVYDILLPDGSPDSLADGLLVLEDYAHGALLLPEGIEDEKGVILAELRARDSSSYRTFVKTMGFRFPAARVSQRMPIGRAEVIRAADRAALKGFYDRWYRPERMVVVAVGDFDPDAAEALIRERFSGLHARAPAPPEPAFGPLDHTGTKVFYHYDGEAGGTRVQLEVVEKEPFEPDSAALQRRLLVQDLAGKMLQERLDRLVLGGQAPFTSAWAGAGRFLREARLVHVGAETAPEEWPRTLNVLEQEVRRALVHGFTPAELDKVVKDVRHELETAVTQAGTRSSDLLARRIIRHLNAGRVFLSPSQERDLLAPALASISLDAVNSALRRLWSTDHRLVLVTGNARPADTPEASAEAIRKIYEGSRSRAVAAPADVPVAVFPYLEPPADPGRVVTRTVLADLDITRATFANGLRLNVKATDFEADTVRVTLTLPGGRASQPAGRPGLAHLAEAVVNSSGLGAAPIEALEQVLAGTSARVQFRIHEDHFAFDVEGPPHELPLMLQLLYHHIRDPAFRATAHALAMDRFARQYAEQTHDVHGTMALRVARFLAGGDERFGWPAWEQFRRLSLAAVEAWLAPRLAQAPLELNVVGEVRAERVIELAASSLGTLAARSDPEPLAGGNGPRFPAGGTLNLKVPTQIDKALVIVAFPTTDIRDIRRTRRLSLLARIFSERLRQEVREKLGASYSPVAFNRPSRAFPGYGVFQALVFAAPQDVSTVRAAVERIAAGLAADGVAAEELQRALQPALTGIKDMRRRNAYWLETVLSGSSRHPEQIDWSRTMVDDYEAVQTEEIDRLAALYLDTRAAATVVITPQ